MLSKWLQRGVSIIRLNSSHWLSQQDGFVNNSYRGLWDLNWTRQVWEKHIKMRTAHTQQQQETSTRKNNNLSESINKKKTLGWINWRHRVERMNNCDSQAIRARGIRKRKADRHSGLREWQRITAADSNSGYLFFRAPTVFSGDYAAERGTNWDFRYLERENIEPPIWATPSAPLVRTMLELVLPKCAKHMKKKTLAPLPCCAEWEDGTKATLKIKVQVLFLGVPQTKLVEKRVSWFLPGEEVPCVEKKNYKTVMRLHLICCGS